MKCSETWLREWVNPPLTRELLADKLTMSGLEVESLTPLIETLTNVVIGQIKNVKPHPQDGRLQICNVDVGLKQPLQIVCGATNVGVNLKVAVALRDAVLPNGKVISKQDMGGVASEGMLCAASELNLSDESSGILVLPTDAPIGGDLKKYFQLEDWIFDISITPNRGDCLSIKGLAREIAALTTTKLSPPAIEPTPEAITDQLSIKIDASEACPHYVGCIIRNVDAKAPTPIWLKERLRRGGIRSISAIVDVTNYVMLELGQPMHAFDLNAIQKGIHVRFSKAKESIELLDGSIHQLDDQTLLIADGKRPLAIAGVMGGLNSSVTLTTKDIFLESAYFLPAVVARQRQHYQLHSDSAYRFERGVDPTLQQEAMRRAIQLILKIAGGQAGPVTDVLDTKKIPTMRSIKLSKRKVTALLGIEVPSDQIESILNALGFKCVLQGREESTWLVYVPSYRFDVERPEDLIEEIARLYGYDHIPTHQMKALLQLPVLSRQAAEDYDPLRQLLRDQGYQEIISYSFIDPTLQALLNPTLPIRQLLNPITAEMAVMRTDLLPGLLNALLYNQSRQQHRMRLFEIGTCFNVHGNQLTQTLKVGGLVTGSICPEQWGEKPRSIDFYDVKGDIQKILQFYGVIEVAFKPEAQTVFHPGQSAALYVQGREIGQIGKLHPNITQRLDIADDVFMFELTLSHLRPQQPVAIKEISKFPEIRRDIALLVNEAIPAQAIQDKIKSVAGHWLKEVFIFDVYQGKGVPQGQKSVAIALIFQHPTRTLVDEEITALMNEIRMVLKGQLAAELRS